MPVTVKIHGALADLCGPLKAYDIATPYEALRALAANYPAVSNIIRDNEYVLFVDDRLVDPASGEAPVSASEVISIVPVPKGEYFIPYFIALGIMNATAATIGVAAATALGTAVANAIVNMMVVMVIQGIASALAPSPKTSARRDKSNQHSYYYDGAINNTMQGNPVPLCYGGPIMAGSQLVSAAVNTKEYVDTKSPSVPADLQVALSHVTHATPDYYTPDVSWQASTDDLYVDHYDVVVWYTYREYTHSRGGGSPTGALLTSDEQSYAVDQTSWSSASYHVVAEATFYAKVRAVDHSGNASAFTDVVSAVAT